MTMQYRRSEPARILYYPIDEFLTVVGLNAPMPRSLKHLENGPRSPFIAFQMLSAAAFVRQDIDEWRLPEPIVLYLDGPASAVCDVAAAWRWRAAKAKSFIRDLENCTLVDGELAAALLAKVGSTRRREKRPPLSKATRAAILAKTGGKCTYCGVTLTTQRDQPNSYHADHLLAVRDGATDDPALIVPACAGCNQKKGAKTLVEFMAERNKP